MRHKRMNFCTPSRFWGLITSVTALIMVNDVPDGMSMSFRKTGSTVLSCSIMMVLAKFIQFAMCLRFRRSCTILKNFVYSLDEVMELGLRCSLNLDNFRGIVSSARIFIEITSDPRSLQHVMMSSCSLFIKCTQSPCAEAYRSCNKHNAHIFRSR